MGNNLFCFGLMTMHFAACLCLATSAHSSVLLVSLGEVRWSLFNRLPNVESFSRSVARAVRVKSVFPTERLPSAYSAVTGVYPEVHGIVGNRMTDRGKVFNGVLSKEPVWWTSVEPLWVTVRKQGFESAAFGFPGADVDGQKPSFGANLSSLTSTERIHIATTWLAEGLAGERRRLALLSLDNPGFAADEKKLLKHVGLSLGVLSEQLRKKKLERRIDVIITGTHGGIDSSKQRKQLCLDKYADLSNYTLVDISSGLASLRPAEGKVGAVLTSLASVQPAAKAYLRVDVPKRLHYSHHRRIPELIVLAEPGYSLRATCSKDKSAELPSSRSGYDNKLSDMHTLLIARGPSFRQNASVRDVSLLDIYPLICDLLGVQPRPNNGSLSSLLPLLKKSQPKGVVLSRDNHDSSKVDESVQTGSGGAQHSGPHVSAGGVILILLGSIAFAGSLFLLKEYFKRQQRKKGGYRLMERSFEPDLSMRSEPLLLDDSLSYRCPNSIQLSIMSESGGGLSMRDDSEDDDSPPATFSI